MSNNKYVVYEIWTRSKVVTAPDIKAAYEENDPIPVEDMSLANWHVVPVTNEEHVGA